MIKRIQSSIVVLFALFTLASCDSNEQRTENTLLIDLSGDLQQAIALIEGNQYDSAKRVLSYIDSISISQNNLNAMSSALSNYGWIARRQLMFDSSVYFYNKSNEIAMNIGDTGKWIRNQMQIARSLRDRSSYSKAAEIYEETLDMARLASDTVNIPSISNGLGNVLVELLEYKRALNYYELASKVWFSQNKLGSYSIAIHNKGDALRGSGRLEEALITYKEALRLKRELKRTSSSAYTLTGMGRTYLLLDSVYMAKKVLQEALEIRRKSSNRSSYAESLLIMSRVSVAKKEFGKAEKELKQVEQIARNYNKADLLRDAFEDQRALYKAWGKFRKLAEVDELYDIMTDSLYRKEKLKVQEAQSEASLEREQQKTQLAEQDALLKTAERDAQSQKAQSRLIVMIIAMLGLLVIGWQLLQIRKRNAALVTLNSRIKLITDNAFHSQKNALGLISALLRSKARQTSHEKELEVLKDVEGKIEALGGVAKSLFQRRIEDNTAVAARVQLKTYLEELVDDTFSSVASDADLDLSIEDIETTSTEALNIGLITNEAVTNFSKYAESAGAETLLIRVTKQSEKLHLSFTDDGPGFPEDFDFASSTGFGMQMMANLVDDMDGELSISREDELTQIDVYIPLT